MPGWLDGAGLRCTLSRQGAQTGPGRRPDRYCCRRFGSLRTGTGYAHRRLQATRATRQRTRSRATPAAALVSILAGSRGGSSPVAILAPVESSAFDQLEARFRDWHSWTLHLPGVYYLQVVEQLYKENRLPAGRFVALGQQIDLSKVRCPLFLLAARDDEIVAPEQIFATEHLVGAQRGAIEKSTAPCEHLGLFMGRTILSDTWSAIASWLAQSANSASRRKNFAPGSSRARPASPSSR